jgi:hypothetical protein
MQISKLKTLTPIIASLLAFAGMIFVALIQSSGATKSDINTIVKMLNEQVIPAIQRTVDSNDTRLEKEIIDRAEEISKLKERIAWLEGKLGLQSSSFSTEAIKSNIAKLAGSIKPLGLFDKKAAKERLPMLQEAK